MTSRQASGKIRRIRASGTETRGTSRASSSPCPHGYAGKGGFTFDVACQALFFENRKVTAFSTSASDAVIPGEYENFTSLLGVNLGWSFGK